eukprot:snap_masked-scaffold_45-processed-gene-1.26-mRNA-1 protein AED:0.46 eAED:0.46 QI:0/-1/0/1/-1/1/1/0/744
MSKKLIKHAEDLHEKIINLATTTFNSAKLARDLGNMRRSKKIKLFLQFSAGDYVLMSKEGRKSSQDKMRLNWTGPFQVTEVVSSNVYRVESLTGKSYLAHTSRLGFYSNRKPANYFKLRGFFQQNFETLEVDKILDIALKTFRKIPEYHVKIHWLGFEEEKASWHLLSVIYEDVTLLVRNFLNSDKNINETEKKNIYLLLDEFDEAARLNLNSSKHKKRGEEKNIISRIKVNKISTKLLQNFYYFVDSRLTTGWSSIEDQILKKLVPKYGCGAYSKYQELSALPGRNKQQFYTKLQRWLGLQSIKPFSMLRFNLDEAREYLTLTLGSGYKIRSRGKFIVDQENEAFSNFLNSATKDAPDPKFIQIPYYRRIDHPGHVAIMVEEYSELKSCRDFLAAHEVNSKEELLELQKKNITRIKTEIKSNEDLWNSLSEEFTSSTELSKFLDKLYRIATSLHSDLTAHSKSYQYISSSFTIKCSPTYSTKLLLNLTHQQSSDTLKIEYYGNNIFSLFKSKITIFIQPAESHCFITNVVTMKLTNMKKKFNRFDVLIMDPPWKVGAADPVRGVAVNYKTLEMKELDLINISTLQSQGSYLFIWTVTKYFYETLTWATKHSYKLLDYITWIKMYPSGSLRTSIGYLLRRGKEICLVFRRQEHTELEYSNLFEQEHRYIHTSPLVTLALSNSQKPAQPYAFIESTLPRGNYGELFARSNNIRPHWKSFGLELWPTCNSNYVINNTWKGDVPTTQ